MSTYFSGIKRVQTMTYQAEAAITQYHAVKLGTSDHQVIMTAAQGEKALGTALNAAAAAGDPVEVLLEGISPVIITTASGLARGDLITPSATTDDGKVEEAASGDYVLGQVLDAPSADDDQVMAIIKPHLVPLA